MVKPLAGKTLKQIRQSIGYNLDAIIVSRTTITGDATSLIDVYALAKGGTNDYKGRQIKILTATQPAIVGEKNFVSAFNGAGDATITPGLSAVTTDGDTYEMWDGYTIEQVEDNINQSIISATDDIFVDYETHDTVKEEKIYAYALNSNFAALHTVEYVHSTDIDHEIHACDAVWDESTGTGVTATADTTYKKVGSASLKLVMTTAATTELLATEDITSLDISDCDELLVWIWSSTALDAGDIEVYLGDTASCASTVETLDIPATSANTWTRHTISLANPYNDSAIISVGIYQTTDMGAFTLRVDDIRAQKTTSRIWRRLSPDHWGIVQPNNYLQLSEVGYRYITNNELMRITGYRIPAELSADISTCDIDPDFVIARATAYLLMAKARGRDIDPEDRLRRAEGWLGISETRLSQSATRLAANTRWVS